MITNLDLFNRVSKIIETGLILLSFFIITAENELIIVIKL